MNKFDRIEQISIKEVEKEYAEYGVEEEFLQALKAAGITRRGVVITSEVTRNANDIQDFISSCSLLKSINEEFYIYLLPNGNKVVYNYQPGISTLFVQDINYLNS